MTPAQRDHRRGTLYMLLVIAIWGGFLPVAKPRWWRSTPTG
jgi:hypothetical protein